MIDQDGPRDAPDLTRLFAAEIDAALADSSVRETANHERWQTMGEFRGYANLHGLYELLIPTHVTRFLVDVVRELGTVSIVDPFASSPVPIASAASLPNVERARGVVTRPELKLLAAELRIQNLTLEVPSMRGPLKIADGTFDWALTTPPLGARIWDRFFQNEEGSAPACEARQASKTSAVHAVGDNISPKQVAKMGEFTPIAQNLGSIESGFLIRLTEAFFWAEEGQLWRTWFADRGFFPAAAISVSKGLNRTDIGTTIVAFTRNNHPKLWVGRLEKKSDTRTLAQNFIHRTTSGPAEFGALVRIEDFRSWNSFLANRKLGSWASKRKLTLLTLEEAAFEFGRFSATEENETPGSGNTIFANARITNPIRATPFRPAQERTTAVPNLFAEIDPSIASAEFLTAWFATDLGVAALEAHSTGLTIQRLSTESFRRLQFPVIPKELQDQYLSTANRIQAVASAANEALDALARTITDPLEIEVRFESSIAGDPIKAWTELLPYPLAAILEVYSAETQIRSRYERLLFFFEALLEFGADILLSILKRDQDLWVRTKPKLIQDVDGQLLNPLRRTNFGGLLHVCFNASKVLRTHTASLNDADELRQVTGISAKEFVKGITDTDLWNACETAGKIRNDFTPAHGGDIPLETMERETERLLGLIELIRPITFEIFRKTEVVRPGPGRKQSAQRVYKDARILVGPSPVFKNRPIHAQSLVDIESDRLAIIERGSEVLADALELTGLIRLEDQPRGVRNTAFFYNRAQGNAHVFRCFQTDGEPTGEIFDPQLDQLIADIDP